MQNDNTSQSPQIGSYLRFFEPIYTGKSYFDVSIPSNRVLPSVPRAGLQRASRPKGVSIPSNRVLPSVLVDALGDRLRLPKSQSPQIGSYLRLERIKANGLDYGSMSQSPQIGSYLRFLCI